MRTGIPLTQIASKVEKRRFRFLVSSAAAAAAVTMKVWTFLLSPLSLTGIYYICSFGSRLECGKYTAGKEKKKKNEI